MLSTHLIKNQLSVSKDITANTKISFKETCFRKGIYYLQHETNSDNLIQIFLSRALLPFGVAGFCEKAVYMAPYMQPGPVNISCTAGDSSNVILLFDVNLLEDRDDYYVNKGWDLGVKDQSSWLPEQIKNDIAHVDIKFNSEICFERPVELSGYFVGAWVPNNEKSKIVKSLQDANINPDLISKVSSNIDIPNNSHMFFSNYKKELENKEKLSSVNRKNAH